MSVRVSTCNATVTVTVNAKGCVPAKPPTRHTHLLSLSVELLMPIVSVVVFLVPMSLFVEVSTAARGSG